MQHLINSQTNGLPKEQQELALQCIQTVCEERAQRFANMELILTLVEDEKSFNEESLKLIRLMHKESRDSYFDTVNNINNFLTLKGEKSHAKHN